MKLFSRFYMVRFSLKNQRFEIIYNQMKNKIHLIDLQKQHSKNTKQQLFQNSMGLKNALSMC